MRFKPTNPHGQQKSLARLALELELAHLAALGRLRHVRLLLARLHRDGLRVLLVMQDVARSLGATDGCDTQQWQTAAAHAFRRRRRYGSLDWRRAARAPDAATALRAVTAAFVAAAARERRGLAGVNLPGWVPRMAALANTTYPRSGVRVRPELRQRAQRRARAASERRRAVGRGVVVAADYLELSR